MTSVVTATVQLENNNKNGHPAKLTGMNDRLANGIQVGTNYRLLGIDKVCIGFGIWSSRKAWLKITMFAIHSPFLLPSFLRGKRKGEKNNQSYDLQSCLSARSFGISTLLHIHNRDSDKTELYVSFSRH